MLRGVCRAMEVNRQNFRESLDYALNAIQTADLITFDTELTGLYRQDNPPCALDSCSTRYSKLLQSSNGFLITQLGVCTYHWNDDHKQYAAKPINFYVFPRSFPGVRRDPYFTCESSSIEFLVQNGFNFNKVFYQGISYLRKSDEELYRKHLAGRPADREFSYVDPPPDCQAFVSSAIKDMTEFCENSKALFLDFPPCNSFERKLLHQLKSRFPSLMMMKEEDEQGRGFIRVVRLVGDPKEAAQKAADQRQEKMVMDAAGVSLVFRAMLESKKLLVGHNMTLDVIHCLRQFHCDLPENFSDFQKLVCEEMPRLADNKVLSQHEKFKDCFKKTHLGYVYAAVENKSAFAYPRIAVADGHAEMSLQSHDAAYDAYMTGYSFIKLLGRLCESKESDSLDFECKHITDLQQKLNMHQSLDIPVMSLTGANPVPSRSHILKIVFPLGWRYKHVENFFGDAALAGPFMFHHIDSTSAYVGLPGKPDADEVVDRFSEAAAISGVTLSALQADSIDQLVFGMGAAQSSERPTRKRKSTSDLEADEKRPRDVVGDA